MLLLDYSGMATEYGRGFVAVTLTSNEKDFHGSTHRHLDTQVHGCSLVGCQSSSSLMSQVLVFQVLAKTPSPSQVPSCLFALCSPVVYSMRSQNFSEKLLYLRPL